MIHDAELEAWLDEALPVEVMSHIERQLRDNPKLAKRLAHLNARRSAGFHGLGAIWRRHRMTCLSREKLETYLEGKLPEAEKKYIRFHLNVIGCRFCQANLLDLQGLADGSRNADPQPRRRRYFESSVGMLRHGREE
jgi:hypothetical protein